MGRFDISPEVAAEYRTKFREGVQPFVDEPVLAAGPFMATGSGAKYAISKMQGGALAYAAAGMLGKKRAGGLPSQFLLAVTATKLHAFKFKSGRKVSVKELVATWERSGLTVTTERLSTTTRVTLSWDGGDTIVADQTGLGDNPWADDVVRELSGAS